MANRYTLRVGTLQASLEIVAAAGSITLTGQAATLKQGYAISASSGSVAVTGQAATLSAAGGVAWLANLPAGLTEQHDIDFSSAGDISYAGERATSAAEYDGTSLSPPVSPNDVARMVLPEGVMGAQGGFSIGSKTLTVPAGTVRAYIAAAAYFSANYTWHAGNHKFFYLWRHATDAVASVVLGIDPTREGNTGRSGDIAGEAFLNADPQVYTGGQNVFEINQGASVPSIDRGEWHYLEMEVVMNTDSSTSDGVLRVWLDGVLMISRTDVLWSDNASYMEWRRTNFDPYYGGQSAGHNVPEETYLYVDHLYIATSTSRD